MQASLLSGDAALEAWENWKTLVDFENLDPECDALLGLLYRNLRDYGVDDAYMPRLKGIYRRTWYANRIKSNCFVALLEAFGIEGIEYLVMTNGSLSIDSTEQESGGYRAIHSLTLLVRSVSSPKLLRVIESLGWQRNKTQDGFLEFRDSKDNSLKIRQQIFWGKPREAVIQQVWDDAIAGSPFGKMLGQTISPTDQFLYLSRQASRRQSDFQPHWIVDAVLLLRQSPLDWERLISQAKQYRLVIPVRNMLALTQPYLLDEIPTEVKERLSNLQVAQWELVKYNVFFKQKSLILRSYVTRFFWLRRTKAA